MKKNILFCLFLTLLLPFVARTQSNDYYIQLEDASGFNTVPYQDSLEAHAYALIQALPDTFRNLFRVYDFGFYQHHEVTSGYPAAFEKKKAEVAALTPYYLLFGKQTDKTGVYTKIWVDLKLPEGGGFSCLTNIQKQVLNLNLVNYVDANYSEDTHFFAVTEQLAMDTLRNSVIRVADCCANNKGGDFCSKCLTSDEIITYLQANRFAMNDSVTLESVIVARDSTPSRSNVLENNDYVNRLLKIDNEVYHLYEEYFDRVLKWHPVSLPVSLIITTNRHFCTDTMEIANSVWGTKQSVIWIHVYIDEGVNSGVIFLKGKGLSMSPLETSAAAQYTCSYTVGTFTTWEAVSSDTLKAILRRKGITTDMQNAIGKFLEYAYYFSTKDAEPKAPNTYRFPSPGRESRSTGFPRAKVVVPDFVSTDFQITLPNPGGSNSGVNIIFYETKATKKTLTSGYRDWQLFGMLDAIQTLKTTYPRFKQGHLYIARTCNALVADGLISDAKSRCIMLYDQVLLRSGEKITFSDPVRLTSACADYDIDEIYRMVDFWNDPDELTIDEVLIHMQTRLMELHEAMNPDPRSGDDDEDSSPKISKYK